MKKLTETPECDNCKSQKTLNTSSHILKVSIVLVRREMKPHEMQTHAFSQTVTKLQLSRLYLSHATVTFLICECKAMLSTEVRLKTDMMKSFFFRFSEEFDMLVREFTSSKLDRLGTRVPFN